MIDQKTIEHIAELSRLELSEEEIQKKIQELGDILNYVDVLQEVDTSEAETADGGTRDLENKWREDEVFDFGEESAEKMIEMAPQKENGQIKVKKIMKD
jgi:aspartyl-tRNA(Asn)/glutamyl-tRNA(Gln) amidotransferase subunit C